MSDVSESLISLIKNEQPWTIRSGCSEEMSYIYEQIPSPAVQGNPAKPAKPTVKLIFIYQLSL